MADAQPLLEIAKCIKQVDQERVFDLVIGVVEFIAAALWVVAFDRQIAGLKE